MSWSTENTFWRGYRGASGEFMAFTALGGESGAGSPMPVIAIDAENGRTLQTLFEVAAQCCAIELAADRDGTSILVAGIDAGLGIWHEGQTSPEPLAAGIRVAAWVPA